MLLPTLCRQSKVVVDQCMHSFKCSLNNIMVIVPLTPNGGFVNGVGALSHGPVRGNLRRQENLFEADRQMDGQMMADLIFHLPQFVRRKGKRKNQLDIWLLHIHHEFPTVTGNLGVLFNFL